MLIGVAALITWFMYVLLGTGIPDVVKLGIRLYDQPTLRMKWGISFVVAVEVVVWLR